MVSLQSSLTAWWGCTHILKPFARIDIDAQGLSSPSALGFVVEQLNGCATLAFYSVGGDVGAYQTSLVVLICVGKTERWVEMRRTFLTRLCASGTRNH
jgi:hypothetical protein